MPETLTSKPSPLDDALNRLEQRERSTWWITISVILTLALLGIALVALTVNQSRIAADARAETEKQSRIAADARAETEKQSRIAADARADNLNAQVRALLDGPTQAFVRPVEMGGKLTLAETKEKALDILLAFRDSEVGSIRTKQIDEKLTAIDVYLIGLEELDDSPRSSLNRLVLELASACGEAWKIDSKLLPPKTRQEFARLQYQQAVETTAAIAQATDSAEVTKLRSTFWVLYWGKLPLVETNEVASAMVRFGDALNEWSEGPPPTELDFASLANAVAKACERALQEMESSEGTAPVE